MWAGLVRRSLLVALLLGAVTGCFVIDEIDKASALDNGPGDRGRKDATAPGAAKSASAKPAPTKPGAGATAAAKPAAPAGKSWWETARSLTSEESSEGISRCELAGRAEFMLRDDCLARGGVPK
jgi:hypothetical protein